MRLLLLMLMLGAALMSGLPRLASAMGTMIEQVEVTVLLRDAYGRAMPNVRLGGWHGDQAGEDVKTDGAGRAKFRFGYARGWLHRFGRIELPIVLRFMPASPGAGSPFQPLRYRFDLRAGQTRCDYGVLKGSASDWVDRDPMARVDAFECMAGVVPGEHRVIQVTLALTHLGTVKVGTP